MLLKSPPEQITGSQLTWTQKTSISRSPAQKLGREIPRKVNPRTRLSIQESLYTAEHMPSGTDIISIRTMEKIVSFRVGQRRAARSSTTGLLKE